MSVTVAGISLKNPVMAASGSFGYGVEFEDVVTLRPPGRLRGERPLARAHGRQPPPRLFETAAGMLNAIGLQNIGARAFLEEKLPLLQKIKDIVFFCNVFGHSQEEYEDVVAYPQRWRRHCSLRTECLLPQHEVRRNQLRQRPEDAVRGGQRRKKIADHGR